MPRRPLKLGDKQGTHPPQPLAGGQWKKKRKNAPVRENDYEEPRKRMTRRFQSGPSEDGDAANQARSLSGYSDNSTTNYRKKVYKDSYASPAATRQYDCPPGDLDEGEEAAARCAPLQIVKAEDDSDEEDLGQDCRATPPPRSVYSGEHESDEDDEAPEHAFRPTTFRPTRPRNNLWSQIPQQVETGDTRYYGDSPVRGMGSDSLATGGRDKDEGGATRRRYSPGFDEEDGRVWHEVEPAYGYFDQENRLETPENVSPYSPILGPLSTETLKAYEYEEAAAGTASTLEGTKGLPRVISLGKCLLQQVPSIKEEPEENDEPVDAENEGSNCEEPLQASSPVHCIMPIWGRQYELTSGPLLSKQDDGSVVMKAIFRPLRPASEAQSGEGWNVSGQTGEPHSPERRSRSSFEVHAHSSATPAKNQRLRTVYDDEWRNTVPPAPFRPPYDQRPSTARLESDIPITPPRQRRYLRDKQRGTSSPSPKLVGSIRRRAASRREAYITLSPSITYSPDYSPAKREPGSDSSADGSASSPLRLLHPVSEDGANGAADEEENELDYKELYGPGDSPKTPTFPRLQM